MADSSSAPEPQPSFQASNDISGQRFPLTFKNAVTAKTIRLMLESLTRVDVTLFLHNPISEKQRDVEDDETISSLVALFEDGWHLKFMKGGQDRYFRMELETHCPGCCCIFDSSDADRQPYMTSCGHLLCKSCVDKAVKKRSAKGYASCPWHPGEAIALLPFGMFTDWNVASLRDDLCIAALQEGTIVAEGRSTLPKQCYGRNGCQNPPTVVCRDCPIDSRCFCRECFDGKHAFIKEKHSAVPAEGVGRWMVQSPVSCGAHGSPVTVVVSSLSGHQYKLLCSKCVLAEFALPAGWKRELLEEFAVRAEKEWNDDLQSKLHSKAVESLNRLRFVEQRYQNLTKDGGEVDRAKRSLRGQIEELKELLDAHYEDVCKKIDAEAERRIVSLHELHASLVKRLSEYRGSWTRRDGLHGAGKAAPSLLAESHISASLAASAPVPSIASEYRMCENIDVSMDMETAREMVSEALIANVLPQRLNNIVKNANAGVRRKKSSLWSKMEAKWDCGGGKVEIAIKRIVENEEEEEAGEETVVYSGTPTVDTLLSRFDRRGGIQGKIMGKRKESPSPTFNVPLVELAIESGSLYSVLFRSVSEDGSVPPSAWIDAAQVRVPCLPAIEETMVIVGGSSGNSRLSKQLKSVVGLRLRTEEVIALPDLPEPLEGCGVGVIDSSLFACGGFGVNPRDSVFPIPHSSVFRLQPDGASFEGARAYMSADSAWKEGPCLQRQKGHLSVSVLQSYQLWAFGGNDALVEHWTVGEGYWGQGPSMTLCKGSGVASVAVDPSTVVVCGGQGSPRAAEMLTIGGSSESRWSALPKMPFQSHCKGHTVAGFVETGRIIAMLDSGFWIALDPREKRWDTGIPSMAFSPHCTGPAVCAWRSNMIVAGGGDGAVVDMYDSVANKWQRSKARLPDARRYSSGVRVNSWVSRNSAKKKRRKRRRIEIL